MLSCIYLSVSCNRGCEYEKPVIVHKVFQLGEVEHVQVGELVFIVR